MKGLSGYCMGSACGRPVYSSKEYIFLLLVQSYCEWIVPWNDFHFPSVTVHSYSAISVTTDHAPELLLLYNKISEHCMQIHQEMGQSVLSLLDLQEPPNFSHRYLLHQRMPQVLQRVPIMIRYALPAKVPVFCYVLEQCFVKPVCLKDTLHLKNMYNHELKLNSADTGWGMRMWCISRRWPTETRYILTPHTV